MFMNISDTDSVAELKPRSMVPTPEVKVNTGNIVPTLEVLAKTKSMVPKLKVMVAKTQNCFGWKN